MRWMRTCWQARDNGSRKGFSFGGEVFAYRSHIRRSKCSEFGGYGLDVLGSAAASGEIGGALATGAVIASGGLVLIGAGVIVGGLWLAYRYF